jgi:hypothetical protein
MCATIKRTVLVSIPTITENLIDELNKELLLTYGKDHANLLMRKIAPISIDDDCKICFGNCNSFIKTEANKNKWDITTLWGELNKIEKNIRELFGQSIDSISKGVDDLDIKRNLPEIEIADNINILVILPLYKPSQSTFLPFLLHEVFFNLGIPGYNYHIIGLLPDLEEVEPNDENYYIRTYACLSECEKILSEKRDLINSFVLLSGINQNNQILGTFTALLPSLQEFLKMSFFNHQTPVDLRSVLITDYRMKPAFFSSWGFSTFIYKKYRFNKHFQNRYITKCIDEFFEKTKSPEDRNLFFTDLDSLIETLAWTDQYKLLEKDLNYLSFSKNNIPDVFRLKEDSVDSMISALEQQKEHYENTPGGYFRSTYLVSLARNFAQSIDDSKKTITQAIKSYLNNGLYGVKKAYALTYALLGKDDPHIFQGEATIDPLNLRTAREVIAEFYKQYLSDEEIISLEAIQTLEKRIRVKQEESEELLRKIESLELSLFGKIESVTEIESNEENLYFTIDGRKVNISGIKGFDGPISEKISPFTPIINGTIPKIIDLRPFLTSVENQSDIGSCTANALVGAYEYLIKRGSQKDKDFSRLFVYYNGREKDGIADTDNGSHVASCTESMMEKGVCLESTWNYNPSNVNKRPSGEAYEEASNYKVIKAEFFDTDLELMKKCLALGYPFIFGLNLYKSFQLAEAKGFVPLPENEDILSDKHGTHAMLCVGYSDEEKCFIVRNSWGNKWGDKGYCYIPYDYMANKTYRSGNNNFLLKTISDVEINETELTTYIGKDNGSLFDSRYDIYDLNAYKENREKLKENLAELIPQLDDLRNNFTRQREKVLRPTFRFDAEHIDIQKNQAKLEDLVQKSKEANTLLQQLQDQKAILLDKKKRLILRLVFLYPVLGLLSIFIISLIPVKIWSSADVISYVFNNLPTFLGISSVVLLTYAFVALLKYKKVFLNKYRKIQDEIKEAKIVMNRLIQSIIENYDNYFEIRRKHKLYDVFYRFITLMTDHVEGIRKFFENWYVELHEKKDVLLGELPEKEFSDSNIVFNAISEKSMDHIIFSQDVYRDYYDSGHKSMIEFFFNEAGSLIMEDGVNKLVKDIQKSTERNESYKTMQNINIFDFLFNNPTLLDLFPDLQDKKNITLENRINLYMQFSSPFIKLNNCSDVISPQRSLTLYYPKDDTSDCEQFINELRITQDLIDNRNDSTSGIMFFNSISMLPAYAFESLMRGYREFQTKGIKSKSNLYIGEEYSDYSCIPDDFIENQS